MSAVLTDPGSERCRLEISRRRPCGCRIVHLAAHVFTKFNVSRHRGSVCACATSYTAPLFVSIHSVVCNGSIPMLSCNPVCLSRNLSSAPPKQLDLCVPRRSWGAIHCEALVLFVVLKSERVLMNFYWPCARLSRVFEGLYTQVIRISAQEFVVDV